MARKMNSKNKKSDTKQNQARSRVKNVATTSCPLENMKVEIADELGVNLGPDATSRQNGSVGGEITKRLVTQSMSKKN